MMFCWWLYTRIEFYKLHWTGLHKSLQERIHVQARAVQTHANTLKLKLGLRSILNKDLPILHPLLCTSGARLGQICDVGNDRARLDRCISGEDAWSWESCSRGLKGKRKKLHTDNTFKHKTSMLVDSKLLLSPAFAIQKRTSTGKLL